MGIMEKITAAIDAAKARTVRNVSDLVQNPRQHLEMLNDRAKSYNANTHPVAQGGVLDNRPLTREEIEQKSMDLALALSHMGPARGRPAAPQDEALRLAQQRAALSVDRGGLGLPAENTAMDRAGAMGFEGGLYHGGTNDFPQFEASARRNVYATDEPRIADIYANATGRHRGLREVNAGPNVIPLMSRGRIVEVSDQGEGGGGWYRDNLANILGVEDTRQIIKELPGRGYSGVKITEMGDLGGTQNQYVFPDPDALRSRFAAFDPWRKTSAIAAVMGVAAPDLLAADNERVIDAIRKRMK